MADNIFRTTRRGPAPQGGQQGDDPLAELARLIGRTNPQGRATRQDEAPPRDAPEATPEWPADARYAEPQARYDQAQDQPSDQYGAQYPAQSSGQYDNQDNQQYDDRQYDDRRDAPPQPAGTYPPYRSAPPSYNAEYEQPDPYAAQSQRYDAQADNAQAYDDQASYQDHPRYDDAHDPIQDLPAFLPRGRDARRDNRRDDRYDDYAEEGQSEDDQSYELEDYEEDDAPPRKRRGFAIFAALLGLMVLGTAGAFSYRAMFGGSMLPALPPIIKADGTPNKIVPAGSAANASGQAANNSPDRLVSREERPVDVPAPATTPRVVSTIPVFPDPNAGLQSSMTGQAQSGQNMPGSIASASGGAAGVPMQLGPAGAAPVYAPAQATPDQSGQAQVAAPVAGTSGSKKIRTVAIHAGQPEGADAATPAPAARPVAPRPVGAPQGGQAGQGGNGPLSIVPSQGGPGSQASQAGAETSRTRTALAHPAAPAVAAEPAPAAAGGGYSVQVSSQRSEAEAQSAYKGLQAKYPTQLGSRTATVRQVDLGDKGIYYRTLVGPYGSSEEAAQMCSSLKAAGGSCLVQRN
jgi:SPOR domain